MVREFVEYACEHGISIGLIMMDIDFFKIYNDQYGHQVGDQVLIQIAETIRAAIRSTDMVGRWGGEEFAVLLMDTSGKDAAMVAERVRQTLQELQIKTPGEKTVPAPTVSLGIAIMPKETNSMEELIHIADQRLYVAKARGRNQTEPPEEYWD
jgi:diguanylate cyclase (GGDEF)-like protein